MFTSSTASREKALLGAEAAQRAMERHECCKSQFKFRCFSCGEMINRGDKITRCNQDPTGMRLRYRGADSRNGLTMDETIFYQAETGSRTWVHIGCIPCYWDSLPPTSNEYSRPRLRPICTDWGVKVYGEWEEWANADDSWGDVSLHAMGVPYFCMVKGYPKEKFMRDRIVHAVTRFQALWRGYIYKKAYPIALREARATEAINLNARATISSREAEFWDQWEQSAIATAHRRKLRWSGEEGKNEQEKEQEYTAAQNARKRNEFLHQNSIGAHMEILMDKNHPSAAIYSAEVIKIQGVPEIDGLYYWVKFHHDDEVRKYHWKRLRGLEHESETFKSKYGIQAKITGKLPLYKFLYP
tara:strand:+ start:2519 stop:3586 length:1068 start_codon:yes stop_codon:yes gene_type:complete